MSAVKLSAEEVRIAKRLGVSLFDFARAKVGDEQSAPKDRFQQIDGMEFIQDTWLGPAEPVPVYTLEAAVALLERRVDKLEAGSL